MLCMQAGHVTAEWLASMLASRLYQCRALITSLPYGPSRRRLRSVHFRAVSSAAADPTGLVSWVRQNEGLVSGVSVTSQSGDASLGYSLVATEVRLPPTAACHVEG